MIWPPHWPTRSTSRGVAERAGHAVHRRRSGSQPTSRSARAARARRPRRASSADEPGAHLLALGGGGRARPSPASSAAAVAGVVVGPDPAARRAPTSPQARRRARRARSPRHSRRAQASPCTRCEPSSWRILRARWAIGVERACPTQAATNVVSTPSTSRLAAMNAVQSGSSSSSSASRWPPPKPSSSRLDAERLQHRVGRARVAELVLGHRRRGDGGLERRRAHGPLGVAAARAPPCCRPASRPASHAIGRALMA